MQWKTAGGVVLVLVCGALGGGAAVSAKSGDSAQQESKPLRWGAWQAPELEKKRAASNRSYLPFVAVPSLHCGIYVLEAGGADSQRPHDEDEVYYVMQGRGSFRVGEGDSVEEMKVQPGTVLFVKAEEEHRFFDIEQDLHILVFFSTAKTAPDEEDG